MVKSYRTRTLSVETVVVNDWEPLTKAPLIVHGSAEHEVLEVVELAPTEITPVTEATTLDVDNSCEL